MSGKECALGMKISLAVKKSKRGGRHRRIVSYRPSFYQSMQLRGNGVPVDRKNDRRCDVDCPLCFHAKMTV